MRVLAYVHRFPPVHNAGAEWMLYHVLHFLQGRGHEVRVLSALPMAGIAEFDGVPITDRPNHRVMATWCDWAEAMVTHLDVTRMAMQYAGRHGLPLTHLVHNHRQLQHHSVSSDSCALAAYNSRWLLENAERKGYRFPSMVLHPPCPPDYYDADGPHDAVLFSNLTVTKGVRMVYALAERMPDLRFLCVRGAYGEQVEPPPLPNVERVEARSDFRVWLARAAVALMPSSYESFGRIAVEAAGAGVPTIACRTPGLEEALDGGGLLLDYEMDPDGAISVSGPITGMPGPAVTTDSVGRWETAIRTVLADREEWSRRARARAAQMRDVSLAQLDRFERELPRR